MDSNKNGNADEMKEKDSGCGPGCDCGKPAGNNKIKTIVILIVALAVCGIFIYKAKTSASKQTNVNVSAAGFNSLISSESVPDSTASVQPAVKSSDTSPADKATPETKGSDIPAKVENVSKNENPIATPSAETQQTAVKAGEDKKMIGNYLDSFSSLNKVAVTQDGVFIFIPGKDDKTVKKEISDAVVAAEKTLRIKGVAMGLYTLKTDSIDYLTISKQVQVPGFVVAVKGRGMGAVTGEITEEKLLQTFVACMNAGGGCGSGGCGPTAPGCN